ncbi:MAG: fasciclin domain-containing protein, partial [Myxococcota bacterium]
DGAAPITVFAPVNSSFGGVDLDALFVDVERLTDLLSYHVAPGQRLAENLRDGQVLAMANGAPLVVEVDGDAVTVRDGLGVRANVTASVRLLNGTVHVVDQLLNPGNLLEQGRDRGFVTWTGLVRRVGLDAVLRSPGPLTAFVPTQAAFASWGVDLGPVDDGVVTNLLLAHLVAGRRPSAAVASATTLSSLGGLSLSVGSAPTSVGGASLSTPLDVEASNGILHALDAVIVPSALPEVAAAVVDLSTTLTALNQASPSTQAALSPDTLTGSPPVTVFAPLDNAFIGQNIDVTTMAAADLDALLGHHVVRGQILSRDLAAGPLMVTTLGGATLVLDQQGTTITIVDETGGQGRIDGVLRDLRTLNGILHVIDRVLQGP